jgi:hypothetical protein
MSPQGNLRDRSANRHLTYSARGALAIGAAPSWWRSS